MTAPFMSIASVLKSSSLRLLALSLLAPAGVRAEISAGLNDRDDGGPAVYAEGARPDHALSSAELERRFPVAQRARIHVMGGAVRGFGMLAEFAEGGPREIVVARETRVSGSEPYTPFALARVFDPQGNLAAVEDFTDQSTGREVRILKVDARAKAGVWRVSFSGGRGGDQVEIRLPKTETWGVRGEMALGVGGTMPRPAYLWVPPTSERLLVGIETGATAGVELRDAAGAAVLGKVEGDPTKRAGRILLAKPPQDAVVRLDMPVSFAGALVVEGAPGLWCPTEAAARRLRGGVVESHGVLTAGPLQARARDWMVAAAAKVEREPKFVFPKEIPADLKSPELQVLMFSNSGFANALDSMVRAQNARLDPADPFFGTFRDADWKKGELNWTQFWTPPASANFQPAGFASAATFESPLNPAYHNADLVRRAAIGAFANFMSMQGDDLLREGNMEATRYPMTHSFFIYPPALAQSFNDLRELLDPEARAIWREALIAVGDKLGDFQGYQSNQWSHMILGHLETYLGTGEKRFLGYFERMATAFFDNVYGPASKYGQHPAGYFLEQGGPDGNYDHLSAYCLVAAWYSYRELPEAKPALVEKIRAGIEKNIRFSSFFWLPEADDGRVASPTAFNTRTASSIGGLGYPGMIMAKADFPLGLARFQLTPAPAKGVGTAWTFAYIANTDAWRREVIAEGLRRGAGGNKASGGTWVSHIRKTYSQPQRVEAAVIPAREVGGTWEVPGLVAWNRGGLYGVVFADVAGAKSVLNGFTGGGPAALWSPSTGPFVMSMAPAESRSRIKSSQEQEEPEGLTFSCVYGKTADGAFFHSGKERAEIRTLAANERYEINAKMAAPSAGLVWRYDLRPEVLTIEVALTEQSAVKSAFVNLPLHTSDATRVRTESTHAVVVEGRDGVVRLEWAESVAGKVEPSIHKDLQRLVIPLPSDGSRLAIKVTQIAAAKAK